MKEPFVNISDVITQTQALSDLELQAYLNSLGPDNPFVATQVNAAVNDALLAKSGAFQSNIDKLATGDSNVYNASKYYINAWDLKNAATTLDNAAQASITANTAGTNENTRQYEINEWANSNKLETLYILQLILVFVTFACVLLFLNINSVVSSSLFKLLTAIVGIIILVIILIRARYTSAVRDGRYWDKSRFPRQPGTNGQPPPTPTSGCPA